MHRVLSYQTAMRATSVASSRDFGEYVTKRTCVSLVLTISFFSLISGFLLGKFVADRQHHIRNLKESDMTQMQIYKRAKTDLLLEADALVRSSEQKKFPLGSNSVNSKIYNQFISCTQEVPPDTNISVSQFVERLINSHSFKLQECLLTLKTFIATLETG